MEALKGIGSVEFLRMIYLFSLSEIEAFDRAIANCTICNQYPLVNFLFFCLSHATPISNLLTETMDWSVLYLLFFYSKFGTMPTLPTGQAYLAYGPYSRVNIIRPSLILSYHHYLDGYGISTNQFGIA